MSTSRQLSVAGGGGLSERQREINEQSRVSNQVNIQNNGQTLGNLVLTFTRDELCSYVDARIIGLAETSRGWIVRAATRLWLNSRGEISQSTMERLRVTTLAQYSSQWSHGKTLAFAKAFIKYLAKMRLDTRYLAFEMFLQMPRNVKVRKAVTSRIITRTDIENVLAHIQNVKRGGRLSEQRALEYMGFVVFGAYTGQRTMATMSRLTVGQFREVLESEKPVLHVNAEQDKIRMGHYVPLHPTVAEDIKPLLEGKKENEKMFSYNSIIMWIKREKIPLTQIDNHFVLGDLRKFAEQYGDVIGWEHSNRSYILTHGVSGVDWAHYKHPMPENVYDIYMESWKSVRIR